MENSEHVEVTVKHIAYDSWGNTFPFQCLLNLYEE